MSRRQTENTGVLEILFHTQIPAVPSEHQNLTQVFVLGSCKDSESLLPEDSASNTFDIKE